MDRAASFGAHEDIPVAEPPGTLDEPPALYDGTQKPSITGPQIRDILNEQKSHYYGYRQTKLDPAEEQRFRREMKQSGWYKTLEATFGGRPSLDDPSYDYRGAWKNGQIPRAGEQWPANSADGTQTYYAPSHPFAGKALVQRVTGLDLTDTHSRDFNAMVAQGTKAMVNEVLAGAKAEIQAAPPEALPGHAVDQNTGRQIPLSSDPKDAIDPRPRPLSNHRLSKGRIRGPEDEPGTMLAHHENSETVTEPGTGEGRNVYGADQGALAGKPLPFDKERYATPEEAAAAAAERSKNTPEDQGELSEKGKRARAKGREAFLGFGGSKTDATPKPRGGYGPNGQYTKDEWEYMQGAGITPGAPVAPAAPTAPVMPAAAVAPTAPTTVGESRKSYMQKRLQDIQEGR